MVPREGVLSSMASTKTDTPDPSTRTSELGGQHHLASPKFRFQAGGTPEASTSGSQGTSHSSVDARNSNDVSMPDRDGEPEAGESPTTTDLWLLSDSLAGMSNLPIKPTKLNVMLVKICEPCISLLAGLWLMSGPTNRDAVIVVQHLSRFKGPLEGQPEPDNPFIDLYVPWCFRSPLLAPVALSVAAMSLVQLRLMPLQGAMALKGQAVHTLNTYLGSPGSATDEAISAVSQLILSDWYCGEMRDMHSHLLGLHELVRLHGGFGTVGVNALVSKTALL